MNRGFKKLRNQALRRKLILLVRNIILYLCNIFNIYIIIYTHIRIRMSQHYKVLSQAAQLVLPGALENVPILFSYKRDDIQMIIGSLDTHNVYCL
jgi:hypothetical protein